MPTIRVVTAAGFVGRVNSSSSSRFSRINFPPLSVIRSPSRQQSTAPLSFHRVVYPARERITHTRNGVGRVTATPLLSSQRRSVSNNLAAPDKNNNNNRDATHVLRFDTTGTDSNSHTRGDVGAAVILYNADSGHSVLSASEILPRRQPHRDNNHAASLNSPNSIDLLGTIATAGGSSSAEESDLSALLLGLRRSKELLGAPAGHLVVQSRSDLLVDGVQRRLCQDQQHGDSDSDYYRLQTHPLQNLYQEVVDHSEHFQSFQIVSISKERNADAHQLANDVVSVPFTLEQRQQQNTIIVSSSITSASLQQQSNGNVDPTETAATTTTSPTESQTTPTPKTPPSILPSDTYVLQFDGGARGNPGVAGAGMVLYHQNTQAEVWVGHYFVGSHFTNNEAEYTGLVVGLHSALKMGVRHVKVQGDSDLIVKQMNGVWQCKKESLRVYWKDATEASREFDSFAIAHIPRAENARADELANRAMDVRRTEL